MLTIQQKAQCVLWYNELKSSTAVQRKFRNEFGQDPHTLTALRDDLKIFWKPTAFWIANDQVGQALMKRLLMLSV